MEKLRNKIDVRHVRNEKDYWKWHQNQVFDNDLVPTSKKMLHWRLKNQNILECIFILDLIKVLMYKFHYDYIKNKYGTHSRLLLAGTGSLIYEIRTEVVYEDFSKDK